METRSWNARQPGAKFWIKKKERKQFKNDGNTVLECLGGQSGYFISENECSSAGRSKHIDVRYRFVAQAVTEGLVRVRYNPTDMNLADVVTKALPAATFDRLVKKCRDSKRGEYYVKLADEQVQYVSDEKTWMVTDMCWEKQNSSASQLTRRASVRICC